MKYLLSTLKMPIAFGNRLLILFIIFICFISYINKVSAQGCVNTGLTLGSIHDTVTFVCGQPCGDINLRIADLKQTTDYKLSTIPYTPYPYIVAGGTEDASLYFDDNYSAAFTLPFIFCYYGTTYNKAVVGSNGIITLDIANASCSNAYTISPAIPSSGGGVICNQFSTYYPRAAFMPCYADHYPVASGSPPDFKIQWRAEGTAPCRRFVASFYHIGSFGNNACGRATPSTFQFVMHESTGIIEFYYENYSCKSSTNGGKAILGIQDWNRTQAVFEAGKNPGVWSLSNTGRRFTPSGGASQFVSCQLFTMGGAFVANATTSNTVPDSIDIKFTNVCPNPLVFPTSYKVLTTYNSCLGGTITEVDTITIRTNSTIKLSSAIGTDSTQKICVNTAITSITYTTTGATGATFSGLPPGVTGNWAANVITISGTPTTAVGSPFNYTVTLTGACGTVQAFGIITVVAASTDPTSATATPSTICNGQSTILTLNGGGGGAGAVIKWYTASCGGTLVGTGNGLVVSPGVTTTYYGRYEDPAPCSNNTACASVTITVSQKSTDPTSATASVNPICNGQSTALTLNGGGGGTGTVIHWYTGSCGGTGIGTGNGLVVSPAVTTTYYGRYEDPAPCGNNTLCATVTVTVTQKSTNPTSATASVSPICNGQNTTLTLNGGGGGTGTVINWYTGSCGGTLVGTGNGLVVSPAVTTTYYGRYEDPAPCSNNTTCATVTVTVNQLSTDPTSATASANPICAPSSTILTLNGGGGGTSTVIKWYTGSCGGILVGTGNNLSVSPAVTTTYYGRYEDPAPCSNNTLCASVTITVSTKSTNPTSATASVSPICNGQSTTLTLNGGGGGTGTVIKWYTASCGGTLVGTGNGLVVSPGVTTTYYGRYEDPAPCSNNTACASVTITVSQKSTDPISATASVNPICITASTVLTLNGGGGGTGNVIKWYTGSCGGTLVGTGNNLTVTPGVTTTYYGRYEDPAPCSNNTACAQVTVVIATASIDPVSATASVTPICNGQSTVLTLNGGGGGVGAVIHWYTGSCGGTSVGTGNNLSVSPTTTTTYYGRWEDAAPCTYNTTCASVTITVTQKSTNPTSATASVTPICNGQNTTLTLNGGGAGTGAVIKWYTSSCGGTLVGIGNGLVVSPVITTTYYGRYEDPAPCSSNTTCATVTVTVNQKSLDPGSATASANPICNSQYTTLTLNGGGGGTGEVIRWYSGSCGGTLVGTGNGLLVNPTTTTIYYGRYEDPAPCSYNTACAQVTVTVNQISAGPVSATASVSPICNGQSTTLTLNGGGGGTGAAIQWFTASCGGTFVGSGNGLVVSPATTTTYYGRYADPAPCSSFSSCAQVTVTVNQKSINPVSATVSVNPICNGQSTALTLNGGGGGTGTVIRWYTSSCGGTFVGSGNGLVVSPSITTIYYGRYEDPAPCSNNTACAQVTVTVNQKSTDPASATATVTPICNGSSTVLNLNGGGGGAGAVIRWYTSSCGGTLVGTGNGLTVTPTITTTYWGRYEDPAPCSSTTQCAPVTVAVNQPPAIITPPSNSGLLCVPNTASFSVVASGTNPTYQWQVSTDGGATWTDIVNGGVYSGATLTTLNLNSITGLDGNQYRVVVRGAAPCSFVNSASAILTAIIVADITGSADICINKSLQGGPTTTSLSETTSGGLWSSSDNNIAFFDDTTGIVKAGNRTGSATIYYTLTASGCRSKAFPVTVHDFTMDLKANKYVVTVLNPITLTTTSPLGDDYNAILWEPVGLFPDQTLKIQTVIPVESKDYLAMGASIPYGCTDTGLVHIEVVSPADDIFVANAFTPNGDGTNDKVFVRSKSIVELDMRIFNQWGQEVFQTSDKTVGWDGTVRGKKQPVGVYVYALKATMKNGAQIIKKGSITLIR